MPQGAIPFPFGDCKICQDRATGIHYGLATCEGCKGFFKRSTIHGTKYRCFFGGSCKLTPQTRNRCKSCRYKRCQALGMSLDAVKMGRIPKVDKERALEMHRTRRDSVGNQPSTFKEDDRASPVSLSGSYEAKHDNWKDIMDFGASKESSSSREPMTDDSGSSRAYGCEIPLPPTQVPQNDIPQIPLTSTNEQFQHGSEIPSSTPRNITVPTYIHALVAPSNARPISYPVNSTLDMDPSINVMNTRLQLSEHPAPAPTQPLPPQYSLCNQLLEGSGHETSVKASSVHYPTTYDRVKMDDDNGTTGIMHFDRPGYIGNNHTIPLPPSRRRSLDEPPPRIPVDQPITHNSYNMMNPDQSRLTTPNPSTMILPFNDIPVARNIAMDIDRQNTIMDDQMNSNQRLSDLPPVDKMCLTDDVEPNAGVHGHEVDMVPREEASQVVIKETLAKLRDLVLTPMHNVQLMLDEIAGTLKPHYLNTIDVATQSEALLFWNGLFESIPEINTKVIGFCQAIPGIINLRARDQEVILKDSYFDIWLVHAVGLYSHGDFYLRINNGARYSSWWMYHFLPPDVVKGMLSIGEALTSQNFNPDMQKIICALRLTDPSLPNLENQTHVMTLHNHFLDVLEYSITTHNPEKKNEILIFVMKCLKDIKNLGRKLRNSVGVYNVEELPDYCQNRLKDDSEEKKNTFNYV